MQLFLNPFLSLPFLLESSESWKRISENLQKNKGNLLLDKGLNRINKL